MGFSHHAYSLVIGRPSVSLIAPDSNGSGRRLTAATGGCAQRSHDPRQLGICPA
jgi:hypothetical protein